MSTDFVTKYLFEPNLLVPGLMPIGSVEVDLTNPLTSNLLAAVVTVPGGWVDHVRGTYHNTSVADTYILRDGQPTTRIANSSHSGATLVVPFQIPVGGSFSVAWLAAKNSSTSVAGMVTGRPTSSSNFIWMTNVDKQVTVRDGNGIDVSLTGNFNHNSYVWRMVATDGSTLRLYENGIQVDSQTDTHTGVLDLTAFAAGFTTNSFNFQGDFGACYIFNRDMGNQALDIAQDPYQILKPATAQLYNFPSVVADHDLLADDLQSTSSVSTPDVGQDHAILADNLQSLSEVETVTVGQEHVFLADDLQSLSQLSTPTATEVSGDHVLLADDLQSVSEVGTPAIAQEHAILADDLESVSSLSTPTVGQEHVLLADDLQSLSQLSTPTVVEDTVNELLADDLESASEIGTATITQIHVLLSDSLQSISSLTTPSVVSANVPLIDGDTSKLINTNGGSLDLYFNGTDYFEVA